MSSDADALSTQQAVLDGFSTSLRNDHRLTPEARTVAARIFEGAVQAAVDRPRSPAEILLEWRRNMEVFNAEIEAKQKNGEISATDAAELIRKFDGIAQALEFVRQRHSGEDIATGAALPDAPHAGLPQGMPADLALALQRGQSK